MEIFTYELPTEFIAQRPIQPPEAAKLLITSPDAEIEETTFASLPQHLGSRDLLVFNDTAPNIRQGSGDYQDKIDDQTIFANKAGSVAVPTASLHFTPELISQLRASGKQVEFVTLQVGSSSSLCIESRQKPSSEQFEVSQETLNRLHRWKEAGGRVIAVGTTVVRALESAVRGMSGQTNLFITPGFRFELVGGVITNFHEPQTTHLLLVEAFLGRKRLEEVYQYALQHRFRFLSYGDGMLITI
ncbi:MULTISPECIES: S-adenosylmethionine:tRNA ribosyltransferase-isomerase [Moorena]|uniref:S-adenosylmethionine:tRNA-ribosyltransferase-isomerase n=3 Tax=Moorena TaxID=1155738 RepID=F4XV92_9CYAN|nr:MULTISPECIES: S-adenosylmethionine:tRNA ribosyltransferase-isomerase [Moorena]NEQ12970.1 S-adenosylmethionine:tRNA ribosyltransferase-isomerase [Moorena sp. SIO3E2]EGJ31440.1 S-adenosylmethionine:tRNA-ribosyltransferase-isomerase [Moorena producens 3L]NEP30594.1 S-adenosylmethionine:tRNA ribosyltransferase-isomerase [Moorena sp. SIO3B2]NEP65818.1 S-adenosylmethionine:tRNA ribosyltransferase-isomerase [Moorena sp. SIO3A5]NER91813.1 S-adenosylmethionine:tRNA ribosyltransferase-isomerase [Moor